MTILILCILIGALSIALVLIFVVAYKLTDELLNSQVMLSQSFVMNKFLMTIVSQIELHEEAPQYRLRIEKRTANDLYKRFNEVQDFVAEHEIPYEKTDPHVITTQKNNS